jgi:uncharacterized membrane protein
MTGAFDRVVWIVAALILIPVLLSPAGWLFGIVLAVLWIVVAYGSREVLEIEKARRQGERGRIAEIRSQGRDR